MFLFHVHLLPPNLPAEKLIGHCKYSTVVLLGKTHYVIVDFKFKDMIKARTHSRMPPIQKL
jgi:hypothetical protein